MTAHAPSSAPAGVHDPRRGIALTILAVALFGIQDAAAKVLVQDYPVPLIVMMRFWAFAVFSLWLASRNGGIARSLSSRRPLLQVLRGVLLTADVMLFAAAIRTVPLGELHAIILVFPILVTVFSIPLLGEKVGVFRWLAVLAGFVGTLIMLRPGFAVFDPGAVLGLGAAMAFALYLVFTRMTAREDSTATAMLYVAGVGLVASSAAGIFYWQPLSPSAWALVAVTWVTTCLGHYLVMRSLHYAPASVVQPFNYLMLPWAIVLSIVLFGHFIDFVSLMGALVIVSAGLTVMWRERRRKSEPVAVVPAPGP